MTLLLLFCLECCLETGIDPHTGCEHWRLESKVQDAKHALSDGGRAFGQQKVYLDDHLMQQQLARRQQVAPHWAHFPQPGYKT